MKPFQEAQRLRLQTLHADAEPIDTGREPALDVLGGDIARVGLERHLRPGPKADRPNAVHQLPQLGTRQQARRAAPDEDRLERTDGMLASGHLDFPAERVDIGRNEAFEDRVGIEVAVLADPRAEGHVQVEAMDAFHQSRLSTAMKASCGISTLPTRFRRFFPSFCFSSSLRLRVTSPPSHLAVTSLRISGTVSRATILPPIAAWMGTSNCWRGISVLSFSVRRRPCCCALLRSTIIDNASTGEPATSTSSLTRLASSKPTSS